MRRLAVSVFIFSCSLSQFVSFVSASSCTPFPFISRCVPPQINYYSSYGGYSNPYQGVRPGYTSYPGGYSIPTYPSSGSSAVPHGGHSTPDHSIHAVTETHPKDEHNETPSTTPPETTTKDLADIFDEFDGKDEAEILSSATGKSKTELETIMTDAKGPDSLYLRPLKPPPGTPYKPTLLIPEPQSDASSSAHRSPFRTEPALFRQSGPYPDPDDTISSSSTGDQHEIHSLPTVSGSSYGSGSYAVAPATYIRPSAPHLHPRPQPAPLPHPRPYPRPSYITHPEACGGRPVPIQQPVTYPVGGGTQGTSAPLVDCCGKCRNPCRYRVKRQFGVRTLDGKKAIDLPPAKDGRCTSEELRNIMMKTTTSTTSLSKRIIQKAAEEQLGGYFSVFCSKEDFSYASRAEFFCQTSKNDIVCFAFRHA